MKLKENGFLEGIIKGRKEDGCGNCEGCIELPSGSYGCIPHDKLLLTLIDPDTGVIAWPRAKKNCPEWTGIGNHDG